MPLSAFHPSLRAWFSQTLGQPSAAQERGWPAIRAGGNVLIAAPTGTGKTLAAFLWSIDRLVQEGPALEAQTRVLYVSPLKALGNDIEKNLQGPLAGVRAIDPSLPEIRVAVRSGDTPAAERGRMLKRHPHILVTTPESLAILLTSAGGRGMLVNVRTVIVDEIHALAGDKRGAHLALSLERLEALAGTPVQRIGLSATQKPLSDIAQLLVGAQRTCTIVDIGHLRRLDLAVEVPDSPLAAVCSHELWEQVYAGIAALIAAHRTTLVFVNTRMLAERVAARLAPLLGESRVACHHGSLSRERRLDAEQRLKAGALAALVATASLELGIDIGDVDLVVQLGSCRSIATFLQRVGRAGHGIARTPKGRLFPLTMGELAEAAALLRSVAAGELDRIPQPGRPLDILAQQVVSECATGPQDEEALFARLRRAWPYRALEREDFDRVVGLHTHGRGLIHRDGVNQRLHPTRRTRLVAITSGGAIPDTAQFQVRLEPEGQLIGSLDEDFSIEAHAGDIIQLGASSWRILAIESRTGIVRVADARGAPPTIPFWMGEGPARSRELSASVAAVHDQADGEAWLEREGRLPPAGARQLWQHLELARAALGGLPSAQLVIAERFFDESGGTQLVIHAPFGGRINRAWGLALRKRICGGFGFELEAAATEDAILLSLSPATSFPLQDIFSFLSPASVRELLIQACITGGQFETRWRWNVTRALVVERFGKGQRTPAFLTRIRANDALSAAFPAVLACGENLPAGPIAVPMEHPLVEQTLTDCLTELMDIEGLIEVLSGIRSGAIATRAVEVPEASPLAEAVIAARPYAFLDDTPLEERRTRAVPRRSPAPADGSQPVIDLDPQVVAEVRREIWPDPQSLEEVHEALLWMGFLTAAEAEAEAEPWNRWIAELQRGGRVALDQARWFAVEASRDPLELMRGRLEALGPLVAQPSDEAQLLALEQQGSAMRTRLDGTEAWCSRRILARIHRGMRERRQVRADPISAGRFLRLLCAWQGADPRFQREGPRGLAQVLDQLAGFEAPAPAWSGALLPTRVRGFRPEWLDQLGLAGEYTWGRLWSAPGGEAQENGALRTGPLATTPICWLRRDQLDDWLALSPPVDPASLGGQAQRVLAALSVGGAQFQHELARQTGLLPDHLEAALVELVARGLISCDAFQALRILLLPSHRRRHVRAPSGRWSLWRRPGPNASAPAERSAEAEDAAIRLARTLIQRTGIIFRQTLARERQPIAWRDLLRALRILELRGEVLGGRFVAGFSGEQYALPACLALLKRLDGDASQLAVSSADPLNLIGILTPEPRIRGGWASRVPLHRLPPQGLAG